MKFHPKLQTLLTVNFILVALCPIIAIGYITLHLLTKSLENETIQKNALLAKSLNGEIRQYLADPQAELAQIVAVIQDGGMVKPSRMNDFLETAVNHDPAISGIQIVDHDGSVEYTAPVRKDSKEINLLEQTFVEKALKSQKPYLSPAFIPRKSPFPTMVMTRPLGQGLVAARISLEPLSGILGGVKIGEKGYAALIDREGIIIAHSDPSLVARPLNVKNLPMVAHNLAGKKEAFHYDFRREETLGCVAVLPELGWKLMIIQPLSEAFAPVVWMRNILLGVVFLSIIMALGIAFFSRRRIVRPFQRLIIDVGRIAKGDYHIEPHEKGYPEIDALSDNFRTMAVSLKAREVSLLQSEERYRNLVEDSFDGIFILKGTNIVFANQRLHEMLGYDYGELTSLDPWMVYHPDYRDLTRERGARPHAG